MSPLPSRLLARSNDVTYVRWTQSFCGPLCFQAAHMTHWEYNNSAGLKRDVRARKMGAPVLVWASGTLAKYSLYRLSCLDAEGCVGAQE